MTPKQQIKILEHDVEILRAENIRLQQVAEKAKEERNDMESKMKGVDALQEICDGRPEIAEDFLQAFKSSTLTIDQIVNLLDIVFNQKTTQSRWWL